MNGLLGRFGVLPEERRLFGLAGLCLMLLGAASLALLNTAETLFLKRVGVEALPLVMLASAGLLVASTAAVGRIASADPVRWLPRIFLVLALAPLPFAWLAESHSPAVVALLLLVSRQVLAVGMLIFWLAMGNLVPARRAKQIFAPLAAGVTIGAILGSFGSEPIAGGIGLGGLIGVCVVALTAAALIGLRLRHSGTRLDRGLGSSVPGAGSGSPVTLRQTRVADLLRESRLFRLLAISLFCGGTLSPILYFEFAWVIDSVTQGPDAEQALLNLYANFRGWMNVAMLVSQLWLSSLLFRRIGLPLSLALWPAAYVLGLTWLGLDFALFAALASWGLAQVSEDGISDSAARVLYNLFPESVRSYATGLLEGPIYRVGALLGNAFLLSALAVGGAAWIGFAAIPLAVFWLFSGLVLWRAYPSLLLRASAEHGLSGAGIDRAVLLDSATLRSLAGNLVDPDPRLCRAAVDLVIDGEPVRVMRLLAEAMEEAPAANRPMLLEALHRVSDAGSVEQLRSAQTVAALARLVRVRPPLPPEQRGDLVQIYARLSGGDAPESMRIDSNALLERALGDRVSMVRLAAIAELHRRGAPPPGLPDLDRTLAQALSASDAFIRRSARLELRSMLLSPQRDDRWRPRLEVLARHLEHRADRAATCEALREIAGRHGAAAEPIVAGALRFVEDRDPRVQASVLALLGQAGRIEEAPRLVAALSSRGERVAKGAREGLVALGSPAIPALLVCLEAGTPRGRHESLSVLQDLEVDAEALEALRTRQLEEVHATLVHRAAIHEASEPGTRLLRRRLEERVSEGICALLDLISILQGDARLAQLERRLRRAAGGRGYDVVVEGIDVLLSRRDRETILPLLEEGQWRPRGKASARILRRSLPSAGDALTELRESQDATTRDLACALVRIESPEVEGNAGIGDPAAMPTTMEIAVHLQEIPAFGRLDTSQLMVLAGLLQEQKITVGERIYGAGDEGAGLYFVFAGEVELRRSSLVFDRVGPGALFGLLSTLDGVPRSTDAVVSLPGRLMRLDREDLLPLLEDAPQLAIGLAQWLAGRVRRLEDRLEAGTPESSDPS